LISRAPNSGGMANEDHKSPGNEKTGATIALTSLARLMARQAAREALAAKPSVGNGNFDTNLANTATVLTDVPKATSPGTDTRESE
jgi:hypothetical protein